MTRLLLSQPSPYRAALRWLSRSLIFGGLLALGYVCTTLLAAHFYQRDASNRLDQQIHAAAQLPPNSPTPGLPTPPPKEGDLLARFRIPRLGFEVAVLEGTTTTTLRLGVGHILGTPLPGQPGNIGIAGHRDTFFRCLKDLHTGDEIQIQTSTATATYRIDSIQIVDPSATAVLAPSTASALTLVTCYPFHFLGPAPRRYIVHALLL